MQYYLLNVTRSNIRDAAIIACIVFGTYILLCWLSAQGLVLSHTRIVLKPRRLV